MEHIRPRKKRKYDKFGNEIGDLQDYKVLMQDYGKLRAEASAGLKPLGFEMISPREFARNKKPSLIERIIQTASPPSSEKEQSPPEIPTPTSPQPPREDKKKGLGDKLFGWLPRGKRR